MLTRCYLRHQYKLRISIRWLNTSSSDKSITFVPSSTPYSDKYYQPVITEGSLGFSKLIIPKDFRANNQELTPDDTFQDKQLELQEIVNSFNSPIDVSIGYGSGILPQDGYDKTSSMTTTPTNQQLDFIHIVPNTQEFHKQNLVQNPKHYSFKHLSFINFIQGTGIYFNPFVLINNTLVKYGIISTKSALLDLCEWNSLYFAGRLQKPVNIIKDEDLRIKFLNQYNLKNAMTISIILLQQPQFTELELYQQITKLSYLGDFRMKIGGENPNKVKNIVNKQFTHFKKLYEPILQFFIHNNYLIILDNDPINRTFKKNLNTNNKIKLISTLPLQFRKQLYQQYYDKSIKDIAKDKQLAKHITKVISRTIQISSIKQAIRGVFTAGIVKSVKYAWAKQVKFWQAKAKV
ncbi:Phosphatidate cytidylyltransferase mitochondrial [Spathaspora sp. JA1]|nr:Phosphatidate cytidylyltransferase mitochondrial [Spathaspora sp. JA1]